MGDVADVVRSRRFELVDAAGDVRACLECEGGEAQLRFLSPGGGGAVIGAGATGGQVLLGGPEARMVIGDREGPQLIAGTGFVGFTDADKRVRLTLEVDGDGACRLRLAAATGEIVCSLSAAADGSPSLVVSAPGGDGRLALSPGGLLILDEHGRTRAAVTAREIALYGDGERRAAAIGVSDGIPSFSLFDEDEQPRIMLGVPDGVPVLQLEDADGGVSTFIHHDGAAALKLAATGDRVTLVSAASQLPPLVWSDGTQFRAFEQPKVTGDQLAKILQMLANVASIVDVAGKLGNDPS